MGRKYTYDRKDEELFLRLFLNFIVTIQDKDTPFKKAYQQFIEFYKKDKTQLPSLPTFQKIIKKELTNRHLIKSKEVLNLRVSLRLYKYYSDFSNYKILPIEGNRCLYLNSPTKIFTN